MSELNVSLKSISDARNLILKERDSLDKNPRSLLRACDLLRSAASILEEVAHNDDSLLLGN